MEFTILPIICNMGVLNVLRALLFCVILCQVSARRLPTRRHIRNTNDAETRFIGFGGTGTSNGNILTSTWQNLLSNVLGGLSGLGINDFLGKAQCQSLIDKNLPLIRLANGGVYLLQMESVTWNVADQKCSDLGMHLVCMETKRENDVVIDFMYSRKYYNYDGPNAIWIGLVDGDGDPETTDFQWISNGLSPTFDYWESSPDYLCTTVYLDEDTLAEGVAWYTESCDDTYAYMCELEGECAKLVPAKNIPYLARHKK